MRARVKIEDKAFEAANMSITLTMTVSEWRDVMRQLPGEWPSWKVGALISTAIGAIVRNTDASYSETDIGT